MSEYPPAEESLAWLHRSGWSIGERTGAVEFWHMTDSQRELGRRELHQRPEHGTPTRTPIRKQKSSADLSRRESPCVHGRRGKSKAVHALARRVGKALYYCHLKNEPFDDSGYHALLERVQLPALSGRGDGVESRGRSEPQRQRPADVAAGRRRVLQRPGEATGMRKESPFRR